MNQFGKNEKNRKKEKLKMTTRVQQKQLKYPYQINKKDGHNIAGQDNLSCFQFPPPPFCYDSRLINRALRPSIFDPRLEANVLKNAILALLIRTEFETHYQCNDYFHCTGAVFVQVITNCNSYQRQQIRMVYNRMYNSDLLAGLKTVLDGNFGKLIVALMTPLSQYYAEVLYNAFEKGDNDILVEVLCCLSESQIKAVKNIFLEMYGESLKNMIEHHASGSFRDLMLIFCRETIKESDLLRCEKLYKMVNRICKITEEEKRSGEIEKQIELKFDSLTKMGLLNLVSFVRSSNNYFAQKMERCSQPNEISEKDHENFIRYIVTLYEGNLGDVANTFLSTYNESLLHRIESSFHGDYGRCLDKLIINSIDGFIYPCY